VKKERTTLKNGLPNEKIKIWRIIREYAITENLHASENELTDGMECDNLVINNKSINNLFMHVDAIMQGMKNSNAKT
jgi:hypothetical protein